MTDLLPCPFCGCEEISLWGGFGTQADISCQSCACERSVQVIDMREDGEPYPEFDQKTFRYPQWLIDRTNAHLIEEWNTRAPDPRSSERTEARWRCYHCGQAFSDAEEARNHFGVDTEWTAACVDPLTKDEAERRAFVVELFTELEGERNKNAELQNSEYLLGKTEDDLRRLFKGAKSVHQAYLEYDSMEGRALAAEARLAAAIELTCSKAGCPLGGTKLTVIPDDVSGSTEGGNG